MMRALYSSVAGLKTHQTKMDVLGNNIANVNTVGFKSTRVTFSTMIYQKTSSASGANAETAGSFSRSRARCRIIRTTAATAGRRTRRP